MNEKTGIKLTSLFTFTVISREVCNVWQDIKNPGINWREQIDLFRLTELWANISFRTKKCGSLSHYPHLLFKPSVESPFSLLFRVQILNSLIMRIPERKFFLSILTGDHIPIINLPFWSMSVWQFSSKVGIPPPTSNFKSFFFFSNFNCRPPPRYLSSAKLKNCLKFSLINTQGNILDLLFTCPKENPFLFYLYFSMGVLTQLTSWEISKISELRSIQHLN